MHDLVSSCQLCRGVRWIPSGGTPLCNGLPTPDTVTHITWTVGLCGSVGQAFAACLVLPQARASRTLRAARTRVLHTGLRKHSGRGCGAYPPAADGAAMTSPSTATHYSGTPYAAASISGPSDGMAIRIASRLTRSSRVPARGAGCGALSTGVPSQSRRMDDNEMRRTSSGGVRFGVYTGPMATQVALRCSAPLVSGAPVGAVGR